MPREPRAGRDPANGIENPHRRLHRVISWITVVCLAVQVIEGSLVVPYVLLYFGFPQLGLQEICDEMYKLIYADDERVCEYPYPLFKYEPEPWLQPSRAERFGPAAPPKPGWEMPGFRGVIERRRRRAARRAAAASHAPAPHQVNRPAAPQSSDRVQRGSPRVAGRG